jgi:hypothetical protein
MRPSDAPCAKAAKVVKNNTMKTSEALIAQYFAAKLN